MSDNPPDLLYRALANEARYESVGKMNFRNDNGLFLCSGVLISDWWVLTAAHCLDGPNLSSVNFDVGGQELSGDLGSVVVHPGWNPGDVLGGNDIGLFRLAAPVTTVTPAVVYRGTNDLDQVGTSVGFGLTGDGDTGVIQFSYGTKRAGNNSIDARGGMVEGFIDFQGIPESIIFVDFDQPGNPFASLIGSELPLSLEYMIARGDSGGGLFIEDPGGGGTKLAGIHSFGARVQILVPSGDRIIVVGDQDFFLNSTYGELQGSARVTSFADWIDSVALIPEPSTIVLLITGAVALIACTVRRRR